MPNDPAPFETLRPEAATWEHASGMLPLAIDDRDAPVLARELILGTVSTVFAVAPEMIVQPQRGGARYALARQVAMYLAHVACELSLTATGCMFVRDRTTVAYACRRVEDARENPDFNSAIGMMERSIRAIIHTSPALRRDLDRAERAKRRAAA